MYVFYRENPHEKLGAHEIFEAIISRDDFP